MKKKETKKQLKWNKKTLTIAGIIVVAAVAIFLYLKIVYFPSRAELHDGPLSIVINDGDVARAQKMDIASLSSFTGDYIVSANTIASLERLYKKTREKDVALSLVQIYISHYQFDDAFTLIKDIYHNDIDFSIIPATTFLYVLFNSSQLSPSNYDLIEGIVKDYKKNSRIDEETYRFYYALLSAYKGETKQFYDGMFAISGSKQYEGVAKGVQNAETAVKSVESAVPYYVDGLSAVTLLQEGYFRVAQKWAVSIREKDPKYILPYQILAQAALLQSHWQEAVQYFDTLITLDRSHSDQYEFGLCASYFWQGSYDNAVLHCKQVKDKTLLNDAGRYVILSYYQTKNWDALMTTFQQFLTTKPSENDYYTFFDIVFYQPFVTDKDYSHLQKYYVSTILPYLDRCVSAFKATSNVCKYGQAGFYLYKNEINKAYKDLLYLASRHPSNYIFRALGQYYEANGDEDKAKAYYLKAMTATSGGVIDLPSSRSGAGNSSLNE